MPIPDRANHPIRHAEGSKGLSESLGSKQKTSGFAKLNVLNSDMVTKTDSEKLKKKVRNPLFKWENLKKELDEIIKAQHGRFPINNDLRLLGRCDIEHAISLYHGGIEAVREKIDYPLTQRRGKHSLEIWENLEKELKEVIAKLGRFPILGDLRKLKKIYIWAAAYAHHGGINAVREKMGYLPIRRKGEYSLSKWENVERELRWMIDKLGRFPNNWDYKSLEKLYIKAAMVTHHGGINAARIKMGFPLEKKCGEYSLSKWENVERELRWMIDKLGRFPVRSDFKLLKKGGVNTAITLHHGGINAARKRMGFPISVITGKSSPLRVWENFEIELNRIIEQLNGIFPTGTDLKKLGRLDVKGIIDSYPGGINAIRKRMGFPIMLRTGEYSLKNWENLEKELKWMIERLGRFPFYRDFELLKKNYVRCAINEHHGGINTVREKMGFPIIRKNRKYSLANEENLRKELLELQKKFGHFPSYREIKRSKVSGLECAILKHHGGINAVRERFGLKPINPVSNKSIYRNFYAFAERIYSIKKELGRWPNSRELVRYKGALISSVNYHGKSYMEVIEKIKNSESLLARLKPNDILAIRAMAGDKASEYRLINENTGLIVKAINRCLNNGIGKNGWDHDDLLQEGRKGVLRAINKYDPKIGSFNTYVTYWVEQYARMEMKNMGSTIRLPVNVQELILKVLKARDEFIKRYGKEPSIENLSYLTGIEIDKIKDLLKANVKQISLDVKVKEGEDTTMMEMVKGEEDFLNELENVHEGNSKREYLKSLINILPPREKEVIELRYGLDQPGSNMRSLLEVGKMMKKDDYRGEDSEGISRERVRQIEEKAIRRLKCFIMKEKLDLNKKNI